MIEKGRMSLVRAVCPALALAAIVLFAGGCSEGRVEIPPSQSSGECVWVNGEWICP
jgi:hypothetical protein